MNKRVYLLSVTVVVIVAFIIVLSFAQEKKITVSQLPENIIKVINKKYPGGEIISVEREGKGETTIYEVVKRIEGIEYEIAIKSDGVIESVEKDGKEIYEENRESSQEEKKWTDSFDMENRKFSTTGRNKYFILEPGYRLVLKGEEDNEQVELFITVLNEVKKIGNIETRIVEERELKNSKLAEISRNFLAIDENTKDVFYFGEDVDIYKNGKVVSHESAWMAGEKKARAGLMVPGTPITGARYFLEIVPGEAIDRAEIISLDFSLNTPAGLFNNCLKIEASSALEPRKEFEIYAPSVGLCGDEDLLLVSYGFK